MHKLTIKTRETVICLAVRNISTFSQTRHCQHLYSISHQEGYMYEADCPSFTFWYRIVLLILSIILHFIVGKYTHMKTVEAIIDLHETGLNNKC